MQVHTCTYKNIHNNHKFLSHDQEVYIFMYTTTNLIHWIVPEVMIKNTLCNRVISRNEIV